VAAIKRTSPVLSKLSTFLRSVLTILLLASCPLSRLAAIESISSINKIHFPSYPQLSNI